MIALVAFKGTVALATMRLCSNNYPKFEVSSSDSGINNLINSGVLDGFDTIIAMGLKNASRDSYVHVEKLCYQQGKVITLDTKLADDKLFKATAMTLKLEKSWCNKLASGLKVKYPKKTVVFL